MAGVNHERLQPYYYRVVLSFNKVDPDYLAQDKVEANPWSPSGVATVRGKEIRFWDGTGFWILERYKANTLRGQIVDTGRHETAKVSFDQVVASTRPR
jgi:hypothetical protein